MSYTLTRFQLSPDPQGKFPLIVVDGTTNSSTVNLTLIGKDAPNYGTALNDNLIWLLENFAGTAPPATPLYGQLWYDTSTNLMKVFSTSNVWNNISGGGLLPTTGGTMTGSITLNSGTFVPAKILLDTGNSGNPSLAFRSQPSTGFYLATATDVYFQQTGSTAAIWSNDPSKASLNIVSTTAVKVPVGSTAQRPTIPTTGMLRFNTTTNSLEIYATGTWSQVLAFNTYVLKAGDTITGTQIFNSGIANPASIQLDAGGVSQLPLSFRTDTTTGIISLAPGTLSIVASGTEQWKISTTALSPILANSKDIGSAGNELRKGYINQISTADGTASNPSITYGSEPNSGFYKKAPASVSLSLDGSEAFNVDADNAANSNATFNGNRAITIPSGTTGTRPSSPVNGMIRYNTTSGEYECFSDGTWVELTGNSVLNAADYGVTCSGLDETVPFLAAITDAKNTKKPLYIPYGLTGTVKINPVSTIDLTDIPWLDGDNIIIDSSSATNLTSVYSLLGSKTLVISSPATFPEGGDTFTKSNAALLTPGDDIVIMSNEPDTSGSSFNMMRGWKSTVSSVSGNNVTMYPPTPYPFTSSRPYNILSGTWTLLSGSFTTANQTGPECWISQVKGQLVNLSATISGGSGVAVVVEGRNSHLDAWTPLKDFSTNYSNNAFPAKRFMRARILSITSGTATITITVSEPYRKILSSGISIIDGPSYRAGRAIGLSLFRTKSRINVAGITTATVVLEGRDNKTSSWTTLNTVTANGDYLIDSYKFIRARITAYTSGTINVTLYAHTMYNVMSNFAQMGAGMAGKSVPMTISNLTPGTTVEIWGRDVLSATITGGSNVISATYFSIGSYNEISIGSVIALNNTRVTPNITEIKTITNISGSTVTLDSNITGTGTDTVIGFIRLGSYTSNQVTNITSKSQITAKIVAGGTTTPNITLNPVFSGAYVYKLNLKKFELKHGVTLRGPSVSNPVNQNILTCTYGNLRMDGRIESVNNAAISLRMSLGYITGTIRSSINASGPKYGLSISNLSHVSIVGANISVATNAIIAGNLGIMPLSDVGQTGDLATMLVSYPASFIVSGGEYSSINAENGAITSHHGLSTIITGADITGGIAIASNTSVISDNIIRLGSFTTLIGSGSQSEIFYGRHKISGNKFISTGPIGSTTSNYSTFTLNQVQNIEISDNTIELRWDSSTPNASQIQVMPFGGYIASTIFDNNMFHFSNILSNNQGYSNLLMYFKNESNIHFRDNRFKNTSLVFEAHDDETVLKFDGNDCTGTVYTPLRVESFDTAYQGAIVYMDNNRMTGFLSNACQFTYCNVVKIMGGDYSGNGLSSTITPTYLRSNLVFDNVKYTAIMNVSAIGSISAIDKPQYSIAMLNDIVPGVHKIINCDLTRTLASPVYSVGSITWNRLNNMADMINSIIWDPAPINNGSSITNTISIPGVVLGDRIDTWPTINLLGLTLTGYASAADTVTLVLSNNTGSSVDLPSGTFWAKASKIATI